MKKKTLLFDFDGVVVDTETQYTLFWDKMGKDYLDIDNYAHQIKGQTLENIHKGYFSDKEESFAVIAKDLKLFEDQMSFEYIKGFEAFLNAVSADFNTAVVTSSNRAKMARAIQEHPELEQLFDQIFTAEDTSKSKPHPECYINGMTYFDSSKEDTVIFEDSFSGLDAARQSGAKVVGLATTNAADKIKDLSDLVIDDFDKLSPEIINTLLTN